MDDLINPYQPLPDSDLGLAPFTGRKPAFARLHQYLRDPHGNKALLYQGRRLNGKTAFLQHCESVFDESFIGVYFPLRTQSLKSETDFFRLAVQGSLRVLTQRDLTLSRLPEWPDEETDLRAWLYEVWLPGVWQVIRPQRQLVWLVDDADLLLDAVNGGKIKQDFFGYLQHLLDDHPQLKLVMTLSEERELDIPHMQPLVDLTQVQRLLHLKPPESAALLHEPVRDLYTVVDAGAAEVYQLTGGQPQWLQRTAFHLYRFWEDQSPQNYIQLEDVKSLIPAIYAQSTDELQAVWDGLTDNEKLLLTAISQLLYDDPLRPIDTDRLAAWLVETDYPLDATAIHAVIRSLDYREIITQQQSAIRISAQLMQRWLLENAQLQPRSGSLKRQTAPVDWRLDWRVLAVIIALGLILLLILLAASSQGVLTDPPLPTVTLTSP